MKIIAIAATLMAVATPVFAQSAYAPRYDQQQTTGRSTYNQAPGDATERTQQGDNKQTLTGGQPGGATDEGQ